jgi:hypothetical protein
VVVRWQVGLRHRLRGGAAGRAELLRVKGNPTGVLVGIEHFDALKVIAGAAEALLR